MVYAICYCPESSAEMVKGLGVAGEHAWPLSLDRAGRDGRFDQCAFLASY